MTKEQTIEAFKNIILTSRETGIETLRKSIEGNRLKKPFADAQALYDLIDSLNEEQRALLTSGFPYLLDLCFFKLLDQLETVENPVKITMEATDKAGETQALISNREDLELRSVFWDWVDGKDS